MTVRLVRYQPFTELRRAVGSLFNERFFAPYRLFTFGSGEITPIDMYHTENEVVVKATLPGSKLRLKIRLQAKSNVRQLGLLSLRSQLA